MTLFRLEWVLLSLSHLFPEVPAHISLWCWHAASSLWSTQPPSSLIPELDTVNLQRDVHWLCRPNNPYPDARGKQEFTSHIEMHDPKDLNTAGWTVGLSTWINGFSSMASSPPVEVAAVNKLGFSVREFPSSYTQSWASPLQAETVVPAWWQGTPVPKLWQSKVFYHTSPPTPPNPLTPLAWHELITVPICMFHWIALNVLDGSAASGTSGGILWHMACIPCCISKILKSPHSQAHVTPKGFR